MKLPGLFRRKLPVLLALSTLGLPGAAWSVVDGEIEPVNGTY
ncbi:TPA: fimbrial protein, partial [Citrobacter farmeri]|nr:fimbrial protein [Citrobacter farmeri]